MRLTAFALLLLLAGCDIQAPAGYPATDAELAGLVKVFGEEFAVDVLSRAQYVQTSYEPKGWFNRFFDIIVIHDRGELVLVHEAMHYWLDKHTFSQDEIAPEAARYYALDGRCSDILARYGLPI